jgi:polysaccharide biosynthesis/export protein
MAHRKINYLLTFFGFIFFNMPLYAEEIPAQPKVDNEYIIQPGDTLEIMVWKEPDLQKPDVLVKPDGRISFPLAGDINVQGKNLTQVQQEITSRINKYIPDSIVTVSAKTLSGNKIFVIGKVSKPGEYVVNRDIDVMQALSMAGGVTTYASVNGIKVLRRDKTGKQQAIEFHYGDVEDGDDLGQNIVLQAGDVIVVP